MNDSELSELRSKICIKAGLRSITPADCKKISLEINKETSRNVSEITLKRLFGFANAKFNFSEYTILSLFEYTGKLYILYLWSMSLHGIFPIENWYFSTQSVLDSLSEEDYDFLISQQEKQKYKKGEVIYKEGVVPSGLFFIHYGKVKKYKVDQNDKQQILYIIGKGELLGYHSILSEERYTDSASALQSCVISFIPKEDFLSILNQSPLFNRRLLKVLSNESAVFANKISIFGQRTAIERLAIALIILHEKFKIDTPVNKEIQIDISRNDLAGIAGIASENVTRLLKDLKDEGIISTSGRTIKVLDILKLVQRSNYVS